MTVLARETRQIFIRGNAKKKHMRKKKRSGGVTAGIFNRSEGRGPRRRRGGGGRGDRDRETAKDEMDVHTSKKKKNCNKNNNI